MVELLRPSTGSGGALTPRKGALHHRHVAGSGRQLFSPAATFGLATFLLLPFAIKSIAWTEPWPAVILPSGASKVGLSARAVKFPVLTVEVEESDGRRRRITPTQLLGPIPKQYLELMVKQKLGQDDRAFREVFFKRGGYVLRLPRQVPSAEARRAARDWFLAHVQEPGREAEALVLRTDLVTVDMDSGKELAHENGSETLVAFD